MISSTAEQLSRFSFTEIRSATGDFSVTNLIRECEFSKVYKGRLIDNGFITVVIQRLTYLYYGRREFVAQMETLAKSRHRNLVSLIGYCSEKRERIVVYEYMPNGTLADHLFLRSRNGSSLSWNDRLKICIGAARGLDYLHSCCSIIHHDVKSTNILLDENFTTKVSDFGLAKHTYLFRPFYTTGGRRASDTYAFGVVLLEVLSGISAVDQGFVEENFRYGEAKQIVASNLRGEIAQDCLKTFVDVAKSCLDHKPEKITMTRVVALLELALEQQEIKREDNT